MRFFFIPMLTVCEANIQVDFTGDRVTNEARRPAYLQATDVRVISSGQPGINYGQFNGQSSQIYSERFFAVTFRRLFIKMLFYSDDSGGPEHQILISNCDSMAKPWDIPELGPNNKPSLAIILSRSSGILTFLGYSEYSSPAIIRLPYSVRIFYNTYTHSTINTCPLFDIKQKGLAPRIRGQEGSKVF